MKNHLSDSRIAEYVEALSFNKESDFNSSDLEHIEKCSICREKVLDLSLFFTEEADAIHEESLKEEYIYETVSRYKKDKVQYTKVFARIAAVFAVTVTLYYSWMFTPDAGIFNPVVNDRSTIAIETSPVKSNKNVVKTEVAVKARRNKPKVSKVDSNRFAVNKNLERMVGNIYRGGSINIVTPDNSRIFKADNKIEFKWSGIKPDNQSLKIVNNLNETVYEFSVQDNWMKIDANLSKGLYYWKLENETDLLYVGRFYVK